MQLGDDLHLYSVIHHILFMHESIFREDSAHPCAGTLQLQVSGRKLQLQVN